MPPKGGGLGNRRASPWEVGWALSGSSGSGPEGACELRLHGKRSGCGRMARLAWGVDEKEAHPRDRGSWHKPHEHMYVFARMEEPAGTYICAARSAAASSLAV